MASGSHGDQLPHEIVWHIFGLITNDGIDGVQTLLKLSLVCKKWYLDISGDEKLWRAMATTLSVDCFPPDLGLPTSLLFSSCRQGGSPHSSWCSVCKLYCGWRKAFAGEAQLHSDLFEELSTLCKDVLPSVSKNCERRFLFAIRSHQLLTNYLVKQRHTTDLPGLQDCLITSSYLHSPFLILSSADAQDGHFATVDVQFFDAVSPECDGMWGNNFTKPLHRRKMGKSSFQKIFALHQLCNDAGCIGKLHQQIMNEKHLEDVEEEVFVVHNVHGDLATWDLWVVRGYPDLCAYWQESLVYSKLTGSGSIVIECVRAGIHGEHWGVNIDFLPTLLEVNSQYVAVIGRSSEDLHMVLLLFKIQTGQQIRSVNLAASDSIADSMLLTDGFLVLNICDEVTGGRNQKQTITVYGLPNLEPLYSLPSPLKFHAAPVCFMALSTCGRYLGVSTNFGSLVIYDMLGGSIKYCGSSTGYGPLEEGHGVDNGDTTSIEAHGHHSDSQHKIGLDIDGDDHEVDDSVNDATTYIENYEQYTLSSEQDAQLATDGHAFEDGDGDYGDDTTPIRDHELCCKYKQQMRLDGNVDVTAHPKYGYKRKVGDGVWLWYRDVQKMDDVAAHPDACCEQIVEEKILFWQLAR